jgi:hypothetical protein
VDAYGSNESYTVLSYLLYLAVSLTVTVWVARTLFTNGKVFLVDAFGGNEPLASSVNQLLVVGFYLINLGYVALALRHDARPVDVAGAIEVFSAKIGWVLLVLGAMHFFNLYVFSRIRRRGLLRHEPPPVAPTERLAPPAAQGA